MYRGMYGLWVLVLYDGHDLQHMGCFSECCVYMLQLLCCMEQDKPRAGIDGASPVCPKPVLVIFKV